MNTVFRYYLHGVYHWNSHEFVVLLESVDQHMWWIKLTMQDRINKNKVVSTIVFSWKIKCVLMIRHKTLQTTGAYPSKARSTGIGNSLWKYWVSFIEIPQSCYLRCTGMHCYYIVCCILYHLDKTIFHVIFYLCIVIKELKSLIKKMFCFCVAQEE